MKAQRRRRTEQIHHAVARVKRREVEARQADGIPTFYRPRCRCGSADLETQRSIKDQGDGSTLRAVKCRACGNSFRYILE